MIIKDKVLEPYYIEHDGGNYTVMEATGRFNKKGEQILNTLGYYSSVANAINRIIRLKVEVNNYDLKEYLTELNKVSEEIKQKLEK